MQPVSDQFKEHQGKFEVDLGIQHHFSAGVYAKQMHLPKGFTALSHSHAFDHLSLLAKGKVIVRTDKSVATYSAPFCITIEKNTHHSIEAIDDTVWFCIHATEETDPTKVGEVLIKKEEV
jgi:quercetin dioxygenase-like cupin family protein